MHVPCRFADAVCTSIAAGARLRRRRGQLGEGCVRAVPGCRCHQHDGQDRLAPGVEIPAGEAEEDVGRVLPAAAKGLTLSREEPQSYWTRRILVPERDVEMPQINFFNPE